MIHRVWLHVCLFNTGSVRPVTLAIGLRTRRRPAFYPRVDTRGDRPGGQYGRMDDRVGRACPLDQRSLVRGLASSCGLVNRLSHAFRSGPFRSRRSGVRARLGSSDGASRSRLLAGSACRGSRALPLHLSRSMPGLFRRNGLRNGDSGRDDGLYRTSLARPV